MKNTEIGFYVDCLIVNCFSETDNKYKTAQDNLLMSSLTDKIKEYFGNHFGPNKTGSIINILAPGAVFTALRALGSTWIGLLISLMMTAFNIDVYAILESIYNKLKPSLSSNQKMTSDNVEAIVDSSIKEHDREFTDADAVEAAKKLESVNLLNEAKLIKLALTDYAINKNAGALSGKKAAVMSIFAKVLGTFFKIALASAGLLVAGDVVNKLLNRPNALDGSLKDGKPVEKNQPAPTPKVQSKQTKFKLNPKYNNEKKNINNHWVESVSNDDVSIASMLVQFAKDVYSGLEGKENVIRQTSGFNVLKDRISLYNRSSRGDAMVYLPKYLTSKKDVVDFFIDEVADNSR